MRSIEARLLRPDFRRAVLVVERDIKELDAMLMEKDGFECC